MPKHERIHLRVSTDMKQRIQVAAAAKDMSVSAWLIDAVNTQLKQEQTFIYLYNMTTAQAETEAARLRPEGDYALACLGAGPDGRGTWIVDWTTADLLDR